MECLVDLHGGEVGSTALPREGNTVSRTWFITGASKGFGRVWAEAALDRGDRVVATARDPDTLAPLVARHGDAVLALELDVTNRAEAFATVQRGATHFGSLDVVVNNAGYGHFGMVEELTEAEVRAQLETNFFGALWVTQAALPILRAQRSGHVLQVTSEGGIMAFPGIGAYHASKWALEGLSQSLSQELAPFGVHVTNVEPGPYATDWLAGGSRSSTPHSGYQGLRVSFDRAWTVGDPAATAEAILAVVDAADPPLRVFLGRSLAAVEAEYQQRLETWRAWQPVALAAFGRAST